MAIRNYTNTGQTSTLVSAIGATDTSFTLNNYAGDPTPPFTAALGRGTVSEEVVLVTAVNGSTVTVSRGYDQTSAQAQGAGTTFQEVVAAIDFREANAHVNATTGVHGTTGAIVDTTSAQTLANKTLTSPTVNGGTLSSPAFTGTATGLSATNATLTTPTVKDSGGATVNYKWVQLTQAAYSALGTKDPNTLYVIVG
jgi:hypothetical protein